MSDQSTNAGSAVSDVCVCVAGYVVKHGIKVATLWKNGEALCLSGQKCYRESDYDYGLDDDDETECDPAE